MQHGFYVNMRDPAFDYVGAEELKIEGTDNNPPVEDLGTPIGIGINGVQSEAQDHKLTETTLSSSNLAGKKYNGV